MFTEPVTTTIFVVVTVVMVLICIGDWRTRTITNTSILLLLVCLVLIWPPTIYQLLGSTSLIVIGFMIWSLGAVGAGDVKLLTILGLVIPIRDYPTVFLTITLLGLGLIVVMLIVDNVLDKHTVSKGVPYAIPICLGGWMGLIEQI